MKPQNQWLFEIPSVSRASYYSKLGFDDELEWESEQLNNYLHQPGEFFAPSPSKNCQLVLPKGKGMFIGSLAELRLTPEDIVKRVTDSGLSWLAIQRIWQYPDKPARWVNSNAETKKYINALRAEVDKDFGIWIWGYPHPRDVPEFVSALVDTAVEVGAQGVIADPEKPWNTRRVKSKAQDLMDELLKTAQASCLSVGITSYGKPVWGRNMAWDQFSRADFGLPQIYSVSQGLEYPLEAIDRWKDKGFKVIVPLLASAKRNVPSSNDMKDMLDSTPAPNCAIAWWSWANTTSEKRWEVIKEAKLPKRCLSKLPADYSCVMPRTGNFELESAQSCMRVSVVEKPTPCRFYTVKRQIDERGLIDLAGRAYGISSSSQKVKLAQWINNHPYNRRFWKANLATRNFPQGRISFNPTFSSDIEKQAQATGPAPSGRGFATIFIPPPPSWLKQIFPSC